MHLSTYPPPCSGSHVLAGHFFEISVAVAVPKGHAAALEFATAFVENAKITTQETHFRR